MKISIKIHKYKKLFLYLCEGCIQDDPKNLYSIFVIEWKEIIGSVSASFHRKSFIIGARCKLPKRIINGGWER